MASRSSRRSGRTASHPKRSVSTGGASSRPEITASKHPKKNAQEHKKISVGGVMVSLRLLVATVIAFILIILIVPGLYRLENLQKDSADLQKEIDVQSSRNQDLHHEIDLWNDPEYVKSQARSRLGYVNKDETQYSVVDPGPGYEQDDRLTVKIPDGPPRPWTDTFMRSVQQADRPDQ